MAGLETGISLIEQIVFYTNFVGQLWIAHLVVIFATLMIITRKKKDWQTLALPVMVGWQIFGMRISWVFFGVASLLFVVDTLSLKAIEGALGSVGNAFTGSLTSRGRQMRALKRSTGRMNLREEMGKLRRNLDMEQLKLEAQKLKDYKLMKGTSAGVETMRREMTGGVDSIKVLGLDKNDALTKANMAKLGAITPETRKQIVMFDERNKPAKAVKNAIKRLELEKVKNFGKTAKKELANMKLIEKTQKEMTAKRMANNWKNYFFWEARRNRKKNDE